MEAINNHVVETDDHLHGVVGSVRDERVEDLVGGGAKLVVLRLLSNLKQRLQAGLEVLRQRVDLAARLSCKAIRKVHKSPTAGAGHARRRSQTTEKSSDERLQVLCGVDSLRDGFADAAQGVRGGVLDLDRAVIHHADEDRKCLLDDRIQHLLIRAFHHRTESRHSSIPIVPVIVAKVPLHELEDWGHYP